jgi:hypothetical protein
MSLSVTSGNAADDGAPFNGWFVGDLPSWLRGRSLASDGVLTTIGPRVSAKVEVKWGIHPAGLPRPGGWVASSGITTLSVLISGQFEVRFRSAESEPERIVSLRRVGDYVVSNEDYEHTWRAIEDSVVLSVRWGEDGDR